MALAHCFVGAREETISGVNSIDRGTGRIDTTRNGSLTVRPLSAIVDEHPEFSDVSFIKIDTDGFDIAILRGAFDLLAAKKPVLFFEYDPKLFGPVSIDGDQIFRELATIGYADMLVYDNRGPLVGVVSMGDSEIALDFVQTTLRRPGIDYIDVAMFSDEQGAFFDRVRAAEETLFDF
jgi:hypothetical protein